MSNQIAFRLIIVGMTLIDVMPVAAQFRVVRDITGADGVEPQSHVVAGGSILYGTGLGTRETGMGSAFKMNSDGSGFTVLHNFFDPVTEGRAPYAAPTLDGSWLYGTTAGGGQYTYGTVYKVKTDGTGFTLLRSFSGDDTVAPEASLIIVGSTLYGTAAQGGGAQSGMVYKMNTDGTGFSSIHDFTDSYDDGGSPQASLTLSGSRLYGSTNTTIFAMNLDGSDYTPLRHFSPATDGDSPIGALMVSGSTIYGATYVGGSHNDGTLYKVNTDGTGFTVLHQFAGGSSDGFWPTSGLTLRGSTLYGVTDGGGTTGTGTMYSINTDGSGFQVLHSFGGGHYGEDDNSLTLVGSTLFGTTSFGGAHGWGTIYAYDLPPLNLDGDYNGDGVVDAADYIVWRNDLGQSITLPNDTTPGTITAADYDVWRSNFGNQAGSGSSVVSAEIPEPNWFSMLFTGIMAACFWRLRWAL